MKPLTLLSAFLFSALCAFAVKTQPYTGSRIFWDSRTPVKVFNGGGYARVMELQDGRLMACCEWSGIRISFSTNKGQTWREPTTIVTNTNNIPNCVPDMIQLRDGTIIVAYNPRPSTPYTDDRRFSIRLKRSTDNGRTWGEEIVVYDGGSTFETGCWEPCLLELPSGELQLYFADESPYTTNNDQQISICRSYDKGLTWSAPSCVSYRAGFRDGMPVPVLLSDSTTIAVAIEDNGWGYNDFVPTIVRNPISRNWSTYVPASSSYRNKAIDYKSCPVATGGAPYLRVLPNGETILSHQSPYNHSGKPDMYVYVGNKSARNFKAMSSPFPVPQDQQALWNSLAVIDTGVVVAVSGYGGGVKMVKGYAKNQLEVPYGHPVIDGLRTVSEGYFSSKAEQILMGSETETYTYADLAYDNDSLYVICRVYDKEQVSAGEHADVVSIGIETESAPYTTPQETSYRYDVSPDASFVMYKGTGSVWEKQDASASHLVATAVSSYYTFEVAIPWAELGRDKAPIGNAMTFNIQVTNGDGTSHVAECIADTKPNGPYTWMPLHFHPNEQELFLRHVQGTESAALRLVGSKGDYHLCATKELRSVQVLDLHGRSLLLMNSSQKTVHLPLLLPGLYVVRASFQTGETLSRKLSIHA
jgi:hypothetical protein